MIFRVQDKQHFPTQRSRKNIEQLFAELFALYFLNKNQLTIQQIDLIDYIVFNKRILRARIKIYDCSKTEEKNVLLEKGYFYLNFASDYTKKKRKR